MISTRAAGPPSEKWQAEARAKLARHAARPEVETSIRNAYAEVETAVAALEEAQADALARLQDGDDGIGKVEIAVPEVKIDVTAPAPLFTTDDDFVTATQKLVAHKALAPDEDDDQVNEGRPPSPPSSIASEWQSCSACSALPMAAKLPPQDVPPIGCAVKPA